jgi:hypothetical protein
MATIGEWQARDDEAADNDDMSQINRLAESAELNEGIQELARALRSGADPLPIQVGHLRDMFEHVRGLTPQEFAELDAELETLAP